MLKNLFQHIVLLLLLTAPVVKSYGQFALDFKINQLGVECGKGIASLEISGLAPTDSVFPQWSTGETSMQVNNLNNGQHNLHVKVKRKTETAILVNDTIIYFTTEKSNCPVQVPKFFTPNGDTYNDVLIIDNITNYPNFELDVFSKWGQRVHSQKHAYTPWDGKWLGVDLPDGVYLYVLFLDGTNKKNILKGDLTILR